MIRHMKNESVRCDGVRHVSRHSRDSNDDGEFLSRSVLPHSFFQPLLCMSFDHALLGIVILLFWLLRISSPFLCLNIKK